MKVEINNRKEVLDMVRQVPTNLFRRAKNWFADAVFAAHETVSQNCDSVLQVRTGALRRSLKTLLAGNDFSSLRASVYSAYFTDAGEPVAYAPIHEYGGTVTAKKAYAKVPGGPYLNIPTTSNKTGAGVMRLPAREVFSQGGYVRKTPRGWGVFLGSQMMFTLKKSVTIPARLGMRKAAEDQIPTLLSKLGSLIS